MVLVFTRSSHTTLGWFPVNAVQTQQPHHGAPHAVHHAPTVDLHWLAAGWFIATVGWYYGWYIRAGSLTLAERFPIYSWFTHGWYPQRFTHPSPVGRPVLTFTIEPHG